MQRSIQDCISKQLDAMFEQNIANTLTGLAGMKAKYETLTTDFQDHLVKTLQRTVPKMNEQQLSNTIHS